MDAIGNLATINENYEGDHFVLRGMGPLVPSSGGGDRSNPQGEFCVIAQDEGVILRSIKAGSRNSSSWWYTRIAEYLKRGPGFGGFWNTGWIRTTVG